MTKDEALTIGEVAARSGLTERALRHYEAEGLIKPARTAAGRRFYVARDLAALAQVTAFKRAGFTVAQIRLLMDGKADLARLVEAQLETLKAQAGAIETAVRLLSSVRETLRAGGAPSAATLLELIKTGEETMEHEQWKKVMDRYYSPEEQAEWRAKKEAMAAAGGFDPAGYEKAWADLSARIQSALPLDPGSDQARGFIAEWDKLLEPFMKVATSAMLEGANRLWANVEQWEGEAKSPIPGAVWKFMAEARKRNGG